MRSGVGKPVEAPSRTGSIKWFSGERSYGFIVPDSPANAADLFVFFTALLDRKEPEKGDKVSYTLGKDRGGKPCAMNVRQL